MMLRKTLKWAAENDVTINFQEIDGGIVMVVRKGDIQSGICLVDTTGKIAPVAFDFVQHLLHSTIDVIRLEHARNPELKTKTENQENHV